MAAVTFLGFTIVKSQAETEIRKLFECYQKTLYVQKLKMCDDITEWGAALIHSISKHANRQKYYIEEEYSKQLRYLNETYNQFIEDLHVREQMKNTEQINQLLERCKALKFELAALKTTVQTIPYIEVACTKKSMIRDEDEFDAAETGMFSIDNGSTEKDDSKTDRNTNTYSKSSPPSKSANAEQANQQPFIIKTTYNDDRSTIRHNDVLEECPTCFMTFSSNMTPADRTKHINGHFTND